jgi:phosphoribosylanthranilate isomerase
MTIRVKICGVTLPEDAEAAASMGADMIGLNFYPKSPRFLELARAREVRAAVSGRAALVGVFVNASRETVAEHLGELCLDMIQFHGDEPEEFLEGWPVPVIRALRLRPGEPLDTSASTRASYLLVDTFHPTLYGGTGRARSFSGLGGANLSRVIVSGGLTPENVAEAAALRPYAVDAASGVESAPGVKDHQKLRRFIENAKSSR